MELLKKEFTPCHGMSRLLAKNIDQLDKKPQGVKLSISSPSRRITTSWLHHASSLHHDTAYRCHRPPRYHATASSFHHATIILRHRSTISPPRCVKVLPSTVPLNRAMTALTWWSNRRVSIPPRHQVTAPLRPNATLTQHYHSTKHTWGKKDHVFL